MTTFPPFRFNLRKILSQKSPCQPAPPPFFRLVYRNTPKEPNHGYSRFLPLRSLRTLTQTRFFVLMYPLQIHGGHSQVIPPQARLDSPLGCPPSSPFSKSKTPKAPLHHLIHPQLRKPHPCWNHTKVIPIMTPTSSGTPNHFPKKLIYFQARSIPWPPFAALFAVFPSSQSWAGTGPDFLVAVKVLNAEQKLYLLLKTHLHPSHLIDLH